MEQRRKLNLSELRVESFDTSPARIAGGGTVRAHEVTCECTGATCGGACTDPDCNSGYDYCDSFYCGGSGQPDTCYAGCGNTCANTCTSQFGYASCDHSQCGPYTCDPYGSCYMESGQVAC